MKGSNLAKEIEEDMRREKKLHDYYTRQRFIRKYCPTCKNIKTALCHITIDIEGKAKCVEYERKD